jgi:FkbM family methyltransferase
MLATLRYILRHPIARRNRPAALARYLRWQVGTRLLRAAVAVPFTDKARLLVERGMTGATGNVYCGLHEFADMGFACHLLRPGDLFADVGANVGSYTVLAAAVCGATARSYEPLPHTFARLQDNVALNHLADRVTAVQAGIGRTPGTLRFTADLDTMNHALAAGEQYTGRVVECPIVRLDDDLGGAVPVLVKIDVEGFEAEVLAGGERTFASDRLQALLIEMNDSGQRYRTTHDSLHQTLSGFGFRPHGYDPFARQLLPAPIAEGGNVLYVRDEAFVADRVRTALAVNVYGVAV